LAVSFFVAEILGLSLLSYIFSGGRVPKGRGRGRQGGGERREGPKIVRVT